MSIAINGNFERDQYVATFTGQVNFVYSFPIYSQTYLTVYKYAAGAMPDDPTQILTLGADYTVTGVGEAAGGTIILNVGAAIGDIITIVGTQPIERESVFQDLNPFTVALNQQLNQMTIMMQQNHTYWANLSPHYNFDELVSAPSGFNPGVRPYKLILPMLPDGHVWVGRGQLGSIPDDIITMPYAAVPGGNTPVTYTFTQITQVFPPLYLGAAVRVDVASGLWMCCLATTPLEAEFYGFITEIRGNTYTVQWVGNPPLGIPAFTGLIAGTPYYLSDIIPGAISDAPPALLSEVNYPVLWAIDGANTVIRMSRGFTNSTSSGGGDQPNNMATVIQPGNTFVKGDVLYCSADNMFELADAYSTFNAAQAEWVVTSIIVAGLSFTIQQGGTVTGCITADDMGNPIVSGLVYYVSPVVGQEGKLTSVEPTGAGEYSKPFYIQQIAASNTGWLLDQRPLATEPAAGPFIVATGGTITTNGNMKIHTFLANDNFTISSGSGVVDYLGVAGGGGGGSNNSTITAPAGGGGAGGLVAGSAGVMTVGVFPVVIGAGGAGGAGGGYNQGSNGANSTFNGVTAIGGGGGCSAGGIAPNGKNGGSGGGAGTVAGTPGTGTAGQGNVGGEEGLHNGAGGGGGAGGPGGAASNGVGPTNGGAGGAGFASAISGAPQIYAGGGGGGAYLNGASGLGVAGGGNGGTDTVGPTAATANTGSGGGGAGDTVVAGGAGGSGIFILTYQYM